ncbi:MAG TPA: DUF459 domain-containing protein [Acidimicrobiales bacterium]|nr:DUF459 domain-containing protein [Acidimicrobiales bacterium]
MGDPERREPTGGVAGARAPRGGAPPRVPQQPRSGGLATAGHVIGVGLVAFGAWFLFDARQLYQSATSSPLGTRRSVSMAITRPVARIEDALSLDRVVNAADRVIGKSGTPGGSAIGPPPPPPTVPTTTPGGRTRGATAPTTTVAGGAATTTTSAPALAPLLPPSAAHPLTILDVGDSIGEDLGIGLANVLGGAAHVNVVQASVGDTGLANLGYYDWLAELPQKIATYHPQVVVVMLGGNDAQSFQVGSAVVSPGTPAWTRIYTQRVGQLMSEATASGARLLWVGLPVMGPTSGLSNTDIAHEDAIYASQAALHRGVTFVSTWKLFEDPAGRYATYLEVRGSGLVQVRDPDEVHIDPPGGTDLVGTYAVTAMERAWHVRL